MLKTTNTTRNKNINYHNQITDYQKLNTPKHDPPANKEWNNSVYAFNNNAIRSLAVKDSNITNLIKSYFNLIIFKKTKRSKRMRDLVRRSTTKQLYVSNAEIKQTSDKAIVTVYIFSRDKQFIAKRMLSWLKNLRKILISTKILIPRKRLVKHFFKKTNFLYSNNLRLLLNKLVIHVFASGAILKDIFFKGKFLYTIKKAIGKNYLPKLNLWKAYMASRFYRMILKKIYIDIIYKKRKFKIDGKKKRKKKLFFSFFKNGEMLHEFLYKNIYQYRDVLLFIILKYSNIRKEQLYASMNIVYSPKSIYMKLNKVKLQLKPFFKNALTGLNYLIYLNFFQKKITLFVPYLKALLVKIYNKKVELNIVNLRHIHLNTDMLLQAMSTKLKVKTNKATRVLKRSLKLVRINWKYKNTIKLDNQKYIFYKKVSNPLLLDYYNGLNINSIIENNEVFGDLSSYVFSVKNRNKTIRKQINISLKKSFSNIKYKWVTGICLSANGRLTKRYTASRAVHKIRYYGSLQNFDYLKQNLINSNPSAVLLRGLNKPNVQNSFITANKRIGAFGIKGWLSGN